MTLCYSIDTTDSRTESFDPRPDCSRWDRAEAGRAFDHFQEPNPCSQRQYAKEHDIPRSTLGDWLREEFPQHLDPEMVCFFRGSAGYAFLRRLVLALLVVFHHRNAVGLRQIGDFLELVELDHFVGASYGALYSLDTRLQDNLILFGKEERQTLAAAMKASGTVKDIGLCCDENFHGPHICLVGIEPVSNFIVVEVYADQRDSVTWAVAINTGLDGLPVRLVCLISDQASGLVCCALTELEVQHHPDLMHLQCNLGKPILLPLARPISQAEKDLEKARQQEQRLEQADEKKPSSVTVEMWVANIQAEDQAKADLEQAQQRLDEAVEQIREVSRVYHPFDRETAVPVTAEQMQAKLGEPLERLQEVVEEAGLGERAQQAVPKAREGWVVLLVGCLAWYWTLVREKLEELDLSKEQEQALRESLMAGYYWERASDKEKDPQQRQRLKEMALRLKEKAWAKGSLLAALDAAEKKEVEAVARACAELFCRSSSCVEGRNGRLSLFHHGQTRLSQKRLAALTVIHNYVVRREDGTTAAERFFGHKHRDAFTWLLESLPDLPRPAANRRKQIAAEGAVAG
jgi:PAS domain-containing protein